LKSILDVLIFFVFLINIFVTFNRNLRGTISEGPNVVAWEEKAVVFCINYRQNFANELVLIILGVILLWLRVINFFRYNEYLGKFIGIVRNLIQEIVLFFCLYLINLFCFSLVAEVCFNDIDAYETTWTAFRTLFFASFG